MRKKAILSSGRMILHYPSDCKYLQSQPAQPGGIVILTHDSKRLGASLLAWNLAKECIVQGENVYIIARNFGELNDDYADISPTQIALTRRSVRKILHRLATLGYRRIILNTAVNGDCVRIAKEEGYTVVSLIHELPYSIQMLRLENETRELLAYSDKVVYSTQVARDDLNSYLHPVERPGTVVIKPQGTYFQMPTEEVIARARERLLQIYPQIGSSRKVVVSVGNTTEQKGFDVFLEVASKMPEYTFVWAGRKERYNDETISRIGGAPANFVYTGVMDMNQLSALYSAADMMLICSRKDTLPSVIFEAMLFHLPIVAAADSGGVVDYVNDTNGHLTTHCDSTEFCNAIAWVDTHQIKRRLVEENQVMDNSFSEYVRYLRGLFNE